MTLSDKQFKLKEEIIKAVQDKDYGKFRVLLNKMTENEKQFIKDLKEDQIKLNYKINGIDGLFISVNKMHKLAGGALINGNPTS